MDAQSCILVTGGAGFIGSHFVRRAVEIGRNVVVIDDLSGSKTHDHAQWSKWSRSAGSGFLHMFMRDDVGDRTLLTRIFTDYRITAVVHFAGKICVGESITNPEIYFDVNVTRALPLLKMAADRKIPFVFSSSAAVYGISPWSDYKRAPLEESAACMPINPYGATKLAFEFALEAYGRAYGLPWAALRYFNAAGAHPDGWLRENHEPETHLIPLAIDAALGRRPPLTVFGDDYKTPDGTCIRDYVHVWDLARAHFVAIDVLTRGESVGAVNLGTGHGYSILQVLTAIERVTGQQVPKILGPRREGDPAILVAGVELAASRLDWRAECSTIDRIVEDALRSRFKS